MRVTCVVATASRLAFLPTGLGTRCSRADHFGYVVVAGLGGASAGPHERYLLGQIKTKRVGLNLSYTWFPVENLKKKAFSIEAACTETRGQGLGMDGGATPGHWLRVRLGGRC